MQTNDIYYSEAEAADIARLFNIGEVLSVEDFRERGNINQHTFLVTAGNTANPKSYLLQRINQLVFTKPENVMEAMLACINAQNTGLTVHPMPDNEPWEAIELIATRLGDPYLKYTDQNGLTYWRLMVLIADCHTYKSLSEIEDRAQQLKIAEQAGRGLALYLKLTGSMDTSNLASPLPGYRDTNLYFNQFKSVTRNYRTPEQVEFLLPEDPDVLHSTAYHFYVALPEEEYQRRMEDEEVKEFVALAIREQDYAMTLSKHMELGNIRKVAIHGDTKLDNFLFCNNTRLAKAMVDLDTIMPQTWLADWGDMVRSLVNVAGEKEEDLSKVTVDTEVYDAVLTGFLKAGADIEDGERELMVDAVQIIALELGIRFLGDYLRGDTYFRLGTNDPSNLNRTRGLVQLTLFKRLRECSEQMRERVAQLT